MPSSDEVIATPVRIIAEWDANDLFVGTAIGSDAAMDARLVQTKERAGKC
jgi:hypothetical protein